jgi:hypothetical protein
MLTGLCYLDALENVQRFLAVSLCLRHFFDCCDDIYLLSIHSLMMYAPIAVIAAVYILPEIANAVQNEVHFQQPKPA